MKTRIRKRSRPDYWLALLLLGTVTAGYAQVPVDDDGNPIGEYSTPQNEVVTGNEDIPLLSTYELQELVGPVALYPDDLLAIVLPASTYPLQIVQAARFLEELESNPSAEPDADWDDAVVALLNYPEVVALLNDDLDWTWRLGEAVVAQQADVIAAVEDFRDRAYAAGNLRSDDHQTVARDEGIIEITPVRDDIIYVPYYEPERVVVNQPRPVYYYYPRPCPVYYYPYAASHSFHRGYFWGVTTAFTVGWYSDRLRVFHHSYRGHPYYGVSYWDRWYYRRPSINVYNHIYVSNRSVRTRNYHRSGDDWRPRHRRTVSLRDERVTRSRHYRGNSRRIADGTNSGTRSIRRSAAVRTEVVKRRRSHSDSKAEPITFRPRPESSERRSRNSGSRSRPDTLQTRADRPGAKPTRPVRTEPLRRNRSEHRRTTTKAAPSRAVGARPDREPSIRTSRAANAQVVRPRSSQPRLSRSKAAQPRTRTARPSQARKPEARRAAASRPAPKSARAPSAKRRSGKKAVQRDERVRRRR